MLKTKKAQQLQLVRNVVRQLTADDLGGVNGGKSGGCILPSGCFLNTGEPPVACLASG